jgi:type III secretory pathway component EscV
MSDKDLISDIKKLVKLNVSHSRKKKEIFNSIVARYCLEVFNEIRSNHYDVYDYRGNKSPFIKNYVRKCKDEFIGIYESQYNLYSNENLYHQQIKLLNKELDYHLTSKIWKRIQDKIPFKDKECLNIIK